jgi:hypothetical protein
VTTAADFEPELVEALNLLIEDERASVEMEVALASGATEYAERDALSRMGIEDIGVCETLRAEMERAGLPVSPQINGVVFEVLGAERYDDRLRAFAHHQRIVAERASDLLESNLDGVLRATLEIVVGAHDRHVTWASDRAEEFAATRLLEFGPRQPEMASAAPEPVEPIAPLSSSALDVESADQAVPVEQAPGAPPSAIAEAPTDYSTSETASAAETPSVELAGPDTIDPMLEVIVLPAAPEATEPEATEPEATAPDVASEVTPAPKKRGRPRGSKNSTTTGRATTPLAAKEGKATTRRKTTPRPVEE